MLDYFQYPFFQRALLAGIIISLLGSYYGVFVVQRRMSFLGSGLAHAAFGGVAIGLFLNEEPTWYAAGFTFLIAMLIVWLREKTKLATDTVIGVLFAVSVAIGVVLMSLSDKLNVDAHSYLFGSVLTVTNSDLILGSIMLLATFITLFTFWSKWSYATFDEELAKADGLKVLRNDYILSGMLALTIVIAIKMVGIILISSFIVIPAASSRMLTSTFKSMALLSVLLGVSSSIIGLWLSITLDLPTGAAIVLLQSLIFFFVMVFTKLFK